MAVMTFNLHHGFDIQSSDGVETHHEVGLRELTSSDIIDAQLAAEKVVVQGEKALAYTSDVLVGLELLRRQVEYIGEYPGPLSIKDLRKLHPDDLGMLQAKADELDKILAEELGRRGRAETAG